MGMDSCVTITFYDSDEKKIGIKKFDCYKAMSNCKEFEIPENSVTVKICFTTEYSKCDDCNKQEIDDDFDYDEEDEDEEEELSSKKKLSSLNSY